MKICIFDLETCKLAQDLADNPELGWDRLKRGEGGVSALAVYDSKENWTYIYDQHDLQVAASHLESADIVVGFRSLGFDILVIEGLLGRKLNIKIHIDLHEIIRNQLLSSGHKPRRGEYTLNALCLRTIGKGKNGMGTMAPVLYASGRHGENFRYCMNDVRLTKELFEYIQIHHNIITVDGTKLEIPMTNMNEIWIPTPVGLTEHE